MAGDSLCRWFFKNLKVVSNCRDVTSVNTDFFFVLEVPQHCDKRPKAHFLFVLPVCIYDLNTVVQAATRKGSATTHNFFFSLQNGAFFSCMSIWTAQVENVMLCTNVVKKGRSESSFCLYMSEFTPQCFSCESSCFSLSRILSLLIFLNICHIVQSLYGLVTYRDSSTHNPKSIVRDINDRDFFAANSTAVCT